MGGSTSTLPPAISSVFSNAERYERTCFPAVYFSSELPLVYGDLGINVGIDDSLQRYSGTNSNTALDHRSSELMKDLGSKLPDYVEKVGSSLGGFTPFPNAVGIGALFISMVLQISLEGFKSQDPNTEDLLRNVFAEEKSSELRVLMDAYRTRYMMHAHNDTSLLGETISSEREMNIQLTRVKDSMLNGDMNDPALKHWTNGAAFHSQMLIHLARLKKKISPKEFDSAKTTARRAINIYHNELKELLDEYKQHKGRDLADTKHLSILSFIKLCCFDDRCCGTPCKKVHLHKKEQEAFGEYMEYIFTVNDQIIKLKKYFPDLLQNLDTLADQQGTFRVPKQ